MSVGRELEMELAMDSCLAYYLRDPGPLDNWKLSKRFGFSDIPGATN